MHLLATTPILGLTYVRPYIFKDFRGDYTETYNQQEVFPNITFVQDSAIHSRRGVLRGYHGDNRTHKLISCLYGSFQITFVCIDPEDERFMKHETMVLDDKERLSVLLPPKFVNAHQCLSDECIFFYKQDTYYKGEKYQYTVKWDSIGGTAWGYLPVLSQRDKLNAHSWWEYVDNANRKLRAPEEVNR